MFERAAIEKGWTRCRRGIALAWEIANQTLDGFTKDRGDLLAAALAYHTLLSIAPLIIVAVAIAGMVLGEGAARHEVAELMTNAMGPAAASVVDGWVDQAAANGGIASAVGLGLVLVGASRLGGQLRNALNQIWNVEVESPKGFKLALADYLRRRAFSFVVVMASGPVLLVVFASRALLTGFYRYLFADSPWAGVAVVGLQLGFSIVSVALISAGVFRFVPDLRVSVRAACYGGVLTSILFNAGNILVGLYLGRASVGAAYGAAGSAVVLLLWLQFSAYMFLLGAELTQRLHDRFSVAAGAPARPGEPRPPRGLAPSAAPSGGLLRGS